MTPIQQATRNIGTKWIRETVTELLEDLSDRSGFDVCDIDDETLEEWAQKWAEIIDKRAVTR